MGRAPKTTTSQPKPKPATTGKGKSRKKAATDDDSEYGVDTDVFNERLYQLDSTPSPTTGKSTKSTAKPPGPKPYVAKLRRDLSPSKNATPGMLAAMANRKIAVDSQRSPAPQVPSPPARTVSPSPIPGPSGPRFISRVTTSPRQSLEPDRGRSPAQAAPLLPPLSFPNPPNQLQPGSYDAGFINNQNAAPARQGSYDSGFNPDQNAGAVRQGSFDPHFFNNQNTAPVRQESFNSGFNHDQNAGAARPGSLDPRFINNQNTAPARQGSYDSGFNLNQNAESARQGSFDPRFARQGSYDPGFIGNPQPTLSGPGFQATQSQIGTNSFSLGFNIQLSQPSQFHQTSNGLGVDSASQDITPYAAPALQGDSRVVRVQQYLDEVPPIDIGIMEPSSTSCQGSEPAHEFLGSDDDSDNKENHELKGRRGRISNATKELIIAGVRSLESDIAALCAEHHCSVDYIFHLLRPQSHGPMIWNGLEKMLSASEKHAVEWIPGYVEGTSVTPAQMSVAYKAFMKKYTKEEAQDYLDLHGIKILLEAPETRQGRTRTFRSSFATMERIAQQMEALQGTNTLLLSVGDTIEEDRSHVKLYMSPRLEPFVKDFFPTPLPTLLTFMKASTFNTVSKEVNIENMQQFIANYEAELQTAEAGTRDDGGSADKTGALSKGDKTLEGEIRVLFVNLAAENNMNWPLDILPWGTMTKKNIDDGVQIRQWPHGAPIPGGSSKPGKNSNAGFGHAVLKDGKQLIKNSLEDKGPSGLKFVRVKPNQLDDLKNGVIPYLIFAAPPWNSSQKSAQRLFNGKPSDFGGPERLPPPSRPQRVRKEKEKSSDAAPAQKCIKPKKKKANKDPLEDLDEELDNAEFIGSDEDDEHDQVFSPPMLRRRSTTVKLETVEEDGAWSPARSSVKRSADVLDAPGILEPEPKRPRSAVSSRPPLSTLAPPASSTVEQHHINRDQQQPIGPPQFQPNQVQPGPQFSNQYSNQQYSNQQYVNQSSTQPSHQLQPVQQSSTQPSHQLQPVQQSSTQPSHQLQPVQQSSTQPSHQLQPLQSTMAYSSGQPFSQQHPNPTYQQASHFVQPLSNQSNQQQFQTQQQQFPQQFTNQQFPNQQFPNQQFQNSQFNGSMPPFQQFQSSNQQFMTLNAPPSQFSGQQNAAPPSQFSGQQNAAPPSQFSGQQNAAPPSQFSGQQNAAPPSQFSGQQNAAPPSQFSGQQNAAPPSQFSGQQNAAPPSQFSGQQQQQQETYQSQFAGQFQAPLNQMQQNNVQRPDSSSSRALDIVGAQAAGA
ncbi:hypothetical protein C8J56DRAFT_907001 [Mycena floridula]|nr:hypothetical protein C8J56DRAFT_907001 [Mycena floridula]